MLSGHTGHATRGPRVIMLAAVITGIALLHYGVPTTSHGWHELHIVLRKAYFIPPVLAAVWFGFGGALWTIVAVSVLFTGHALLDWPGNYMEQANQVGELAGFWVIGLLAGHWFDRQRTLLEELATAHEETVNGLVSALDLREHNTGMHSQRVREYTLLLADRLGVDQEMRRHIAYGALLHDVGKIAVPDHILLKPGRLTDEEWVEIREHPDVGYRIVQPVPFLRQAADIVHAHHERFDGSGYPRGLNGEHIPLGARLFAVADVYDALTSDRPYHAAMTHEQAAAEIRAGDGTHFDPAVVAVFLGVPRAELAAIAGRWRDAAIAMIATNAAAQMRPSPGNQDVVRQMPTGGHVRVHPVVVLLIPLVASGCMMAGMAAMGGGGHMIGGGAPHGGTADSTRQPTVIKEVMSGSLRVTAEFPFFTAGDSLRYVATIQDRVGRARTENAIVFLETSPATGNVAASPVPTHAGHPSMIMTAPSSGLERTRLTPVERAEGRYVFRPTIPAGGVYRLAIVVEQVGDSILNPPIVVDHTAHIAHVQGHAWWAGGVTPLAILGTAFMAVMMFVAIR